ncbi:hypothetical protein Agub_g10678 [Astrephomene gubernaculifera]|uniref:peptidylprolyl isomerase n=1 Tax=Astrephomene gubernaculifera TaxID=47775 RepID=A0AAD3DZQ9_9CHLO|nr:hypothetical protein Agub_g10678 [Astrephomene gubernaculifera]
MLSLHQGDVANVRQSSRGIPYAFPIRFCRNLHRRATARSAPEKSSLRVADTATENSSTDVNAGDTAKPTLPQQAPVAARATSGAGTEVTTAAARKQQQQRSVRRAESTDAVATFLTRRFGIAGGLAWLGFLAVGTLGEQIKTRMEVANEVNGTKEVQDAPEVVLPSGVRYRDLRVGGGQSPLKGYLVVLDYTATTDGVQFESTRARGKPIVYLYGSRPFTGGMCAGLEQALATMRAGGRRIVTVPADLGFGERGAVLRPTEHVPDKKGLVPPGATLVYDVELVRVSIPPS